MQQRYYDPLAGRFLSVDPVVTDVKTGGHFNRFAYADNNPYKYKDPDGRNPVLGLIMLGMMLNEIANGDVPMPGASAGKAALGAAERLTVNAAKGKVGEAATRAVIGTQKAGEQVTVVASTGERAVLDFIKKDGVIVETKTGGASLTKGQAAVKADVAAGRSVNPVGENAKAAGFEPGVAVKFKDFVEVRPF